MKINKRNLLLISFLGAVSLLGGMQGKAQSPEAHEHWVSAWGASPYAPLQFPGMPPIPEISDKTIRMIIRPTATGQKLRIRFSNAFGTKPLEIGAASVAVSEDGSKTSMAHVLTFGGRPTASVPPGALAVSDPLAMSVAAFKPLAVSIYLPQATPVSTWHQLAKHESYIAGPGDQTLKPELSSAQSSRFWYFVSSLEVLAPSGATAMITFGDSITDGDGDRAHPEANWPDQLAARLAAEQPGSEIAIVNEGISGNRILHDAAGVSALARFDRDVLALPGVTSLLILEGINDIGFPRVRLAEIKNFPAPKVNPFLSEKVSAGEIIAGLMQMISRAHEHGIRVFGATLTPFEGTNSYDAEGEAIRQEVNHWIRTSNAYDAVFDLDALVRDPEHPARLQKAFDSGDHIHPSPDGYKAIAASIPLAVLRGK